MWGTPGLNPRPSLPWHSVQSAIEPEGAAACAKLAAEPNSNAAVTTQLARRTFPVIAVGEFFSMTMTQNERVEAFYRLAESSCALQGTEAEG
jgi:hypothetical protein